MAFRDTDADIEDVAGKPVADIFVDDGEPHFRALEEQAVAAALAEHDGVLALGGGAVLSARDPGAAGAHAAAGHRRLARRRPAGGGQAGRAGPRPAAARR